MSVLDSTRILCSTSLVGCLGDELMLRVMDPATCEAQGDGGWASLYHL